MTATPKAKPAQEIIASRDNRWLKRFRAALEGASKEVVGLEGPRLVEEAFRSRVAVEAVLVCEAGERNLTRLKAWMTRDVRVLRCSDRLFATVAATETPQGIAALVRVRKWEFAELLGAETAQERARTNSDAPINRGATFEKTFGVALVIVLAGVQDPGNVGTLLRSGEAFGATGAVACQGTAHPFSPKAMRASAGSALRLPVVMGITAENAVARMHQAGLRVYAASAASGVAPAEADFCGPCALLIGNEAAGLPAELERAADARLRIPLTEGVESLNAAVAGAVLLYEAARQRSAKRTVNLSGDSEGRR